MRFKVQEPLVDARAIVELASSFGPIAVNRAYCNWQYCGRYRDALLQSAVELVQLFPPGPSAQNGADIKLCLDASEDLARFSHLGTIINIVGGDSDFMPVSQKIKAAGRTLVGLGTRKSTNRHWAKSCHELQYYENLSGEEESPVSIAEQVPVAPARLSSTNFQLSASRQLSHGHEVTHELRQLRQLVPSMSRNTAAGRRCPCEDDVDGGAVLHLARELGGQRGRIHLQHLHMQCSGSR